MSRPRPVAAAVRPARAGTQTAAVQPPSRRSTPAGSSVQLQIQRLALEGFDLDARQEGAVRAALEVELGALLAAGPLPTRLGSGGSTPRLVGRDLEIGSWSDAGDLGRQVAKALHAGLRR